jgi:hypothetical protein
MSASARETYVVWRVSIYGWLLLEKEALFISAEFDIISNGYTEEK